MKQLHLRMSESLIDRLEELKELTDASSRAEVLRDSLCVYAWFLNQIEQGNKILAVNSKNGVKKETTISTPGVEATKAKAKQKVTQS